MNNLFLIHWFNPKLPHDSAFKMTPLKYHVFENIMENGAFALLEQMLHFSLYFQKYSKLNLSELFVEFFQCHLKIENVMS